METTPCTNCGAPLTESLRFCPRCGTGVARSGVAPTPMTATRPSTRVGQNSVQCGTCGTQMVPGLQYCFACGAQIRVEDSPAAFRMQAEAAPMAPKRMSTGMKILIALGIVMVLGFAACGACVAAVMHMAPKAELQNAERMRREFPAELTAKMPADEAAFCAAISKAAKATKDAGGLSATDEQVKLINSERATALRDLTANPTVSGWVGLVLSMNVTNGAADLTIQLPCEANFTTHGVWPRPDKEPGKVKLGRFSAMQGTPAYAAVVQVHGGQSIAFDGTLGIDAQGALQTANLSDRARLMAPNFLIQLSDVRNEPIAGGTKEPAPEDSPTP